MWQNICNKTSSSMTVCLPKFTRALLKQNTQKLSFNNFDLKTDLRKEAGTRTLATFNMELFGTIVNNQSLSVVIKSSITDMTAVLDLFLGGHISEDDSIYKHCRAFFGYLVSSMRVGGISTVWAQKNHTRKIGNICKDFNNTKSSCVNVYAKTFQCSYYNYGLQERSANFGLRVSKGFWAGGVGTVWAQKIIQEKSVILTKIFEL